MKTWHWPEKVCVQCGQAYIPKGKHQKFHNRKCYGLSLRISQRGRDIQAMQHRRSEVMRARVRAQIEAAFGPLSERELDLERLALSRGYQKGYRVARRDNRREDAA